jgi:hypothetical protein
MGLTNLIVGGMGAIAHPEAFSGDRESVVVTMKDTGIEAMQGPSKQQAEEWSLWTQE